MKTRDQQEHTAMQLFDKGIAAFKNGLDEPCHKIIALGWQYARDERELKNRYIENMRDILNTTTTTIDSMSIESKIYQELINYSKQLQNKTIDLDNYQDNYKLETIRSRWKFTHVQLWTLLDNLQDMQLITIDSLKLIIHY